MDAPATAPDELVAPVLPVREPLTVSADWDDLGESGEGPALPRPADSGEEHASAQPQAAAEWDIAQEPAVPAQSLTEGLPAVDDSLGDQSRGAGWCAQCGALLSASDIFCGECGFVRSPAARPRDTAVLDPFPWGIAPSAPPAGPPADAPPSDDVDDTRLVAPGARADRFVLQFSTGESVTVTGAGLLGRNPMPEPGEYFDSLVTISDPGKSVSKTHLEFGNEGGTFWVSDRYSGNGTIVREPDRPSRRCEPGKRYRIARGTRVDIGEQFFVVS